uniref:Serine aminopeptidase S33 domain-containing protein n=1 Tax=Mycena chlorophos TaxID=658473 RepID=A0ABQ0LYR0_MYCCL|nr:predicted protein [Mycena chlorophos]
MPLHKIEDMQSDAYTEAWLVGPHETKFYTRTYTASPDTSKAALVWIHGFAEHVGRYTEAHPVLAAAGINVFAFDQRGFGKTALDTENKSRSSAYGKTSGRNQMEDVKWALSHAKETFPGLPLFLAGHSMGGMEVLNYATRHKGEGTRGIIACSPLVAQTIPASKLLRAAGGLFALPLPNFTMPAEVEYDDLSHDEAYNNMCKVDKLSIQQGTLRGLSDMLNWGEELLKDQLYLRWPKNLPLLLLHGTGDRVTSCKKSALFYEHVTTDYKRTVEFPNGFHELLHEPEHRERMLKEIIDYVDLCSLEGEARNAGDGGAASAPTASVPAAEAAGAVAPEAKL